MTTPDDLRARLRVESGRFREGERRRRFDVALHVGTPGGARASVVVPAKQLAYVDRETRIELYSAMLEVAPGGTDSAWLTRPGTAALEPDDTAWMVGAMAAFGAAGMSLDGFFAVTRDGWVDVRTGERRVWKRLRLDR
jgi:hypothetical protein